MTTLYIASGVLALRSAHEMAESWGDRSGKNILDAKIPAGRTLRLQEEAAVQNQVELKRILEERMFEAKLDDIVIYVEIGTTAGGLLAIVETVKATSPTSSVGAVIVNRSPLVPGTNPEVLEDLDLLGNALWHYTLDGRLAWHMVCDGSPYVGTRPSKEEMTAKKFGSRLYGE